MQRKAPLFSFLPRFFSKKRAGSGSARRSGISFLQSFFLCACGRKEKSVKRQAEMNAQHKNKRLLCDGYFHRTIAFLFYSSPHCSFCALSKRESSSRIHGRFSSFDNSKYLASSSSSENRRSEHSNKCKTAFCSPCLMASSVSFILLPPITYTR